MRPLAICLECQLPCRSDDAETDPRIRCHCDAAITLESRNGDKICPACAGSRALHLREETGISAFLECRVCSGVWLELEDFSEICRQAKTAAPLPLSPGHRPRAQILDLSQEASQAGGRFYRLCPVDKNPMNRRNVASRSGVIVDYCPEHGVWLDGNELAQLIEWIRQGGMDRFEGESLLKPARKPADPQPRPIGAPSLTSSREESTLAWIVDVLHLIFS